MAEKSNGKPLCSLYLATMELLLNRGPDQPMRLISDETGLPQAWLWSLIDNPGMRTDVHRIQQLYEYLSGKRLRL